MTLAPRSSLAVLAAAALLAACGSSVNLQDTPVESRDPVTGSVPGTAPGTAAGGTPAPAAQSSVATVNLGANAAAAAPAARIVYFDYDSFAVRDEYRALIEGHARALAANRGKRMVVEGHADERGSREYNLALGQKRAESVVRSLVLLGATEAQLEAVSFGEERPAAQGSDEAAWAQNRRAELRDR
ncbi:MAG: peptidoglycan-associated lipoprotein Pal [Rubrivivax sp.]|jgi:peptidoglycan-associated lipoprotein|nr:peptidoglycan-associated lipoprotein Pal [Rubrivivax sp.]